MTIEEILNDPLCTECGGRLIKDHEWVCSRCGLVDSPILVAPLQDTYRNNMESWSQKANRRERQPKIQKVVPIHFYKDAHDALKKLAKKNHRSQGMYLSIILADAMDKDIIFETTDKTQKRIDCKILPNIKNEFKTFCQTKGISMTQAVNQIILRKYRDFIKNSVMKK